MAQLGLQSRLVLIAMLVLGAGLGAVGWGLDSSFEKAVFAGAEDRLRAVVYSLLSAARERDDRLLFDELGEPRLSQGSSGLYAYVDTSSGEVVWRSPSVETLSGSRISIQPPIARRPAPGEFRFDLAQLDPDTPRFVMAYSVFWEPLDAEMTFWVLLDKHPYVERIAVFRRNAAGGLAAAAAVFVAIQLAALRWGLRPVRTMANRVRGLEAGAQGDIGDDYPRELSGLARNLNRFIANEKANRERYRRAMDDLAHSLKTPLAVLKNAVLDLNRPQAELFGEQVERMETTVGHQLARAAAVRTVLPTASVAVLPVAKRIALALERAYQDKRLAIELPDDDAAQAQLAVQVDERDLLEMLGNLIENAFKYTRTRVRIDARATANGVLASIEDDGSGIAADQRDLVLQRGLRADAATSGQGIGLAVVAELASLYEGTLSIGDSDLGGAAVCLELPSRAKGPNGALSG